MHLRVHGDFDYLLTDTMHTERVIFIYEVFRLRVFRYIQKYFDKPTHKNNTRKYETIFRGDLLL